MKTFLFKKINLFLSLTLLLFAATGCDSTDDDPAEMDIVAVANDAGFNTLVTAVAAADLEATLSGPGPFTVFAPTDAAFAALPDGTLDSLLEPDNQQTLASVLTYHVVSGEVTAEQVVGLSTAITVQGAEIQITVDNGTVFINGIEVIQTDVTASNGVIHVIDGVLLPPSLQ